MKRLLATVFFGVFILSLSFIQPANAVTVYYQPTPYPLLKYDNTAMSQDIGIVHIWDGWITNVYYGKMFIRDDKMKRK